MCDVILSKTKTGETPVSIQANRSAHFCMKITDFVTSKSSSIWLVFVSEQTGYGVTCTPSQILTTDLHGRIFVMLSPDCSFCETTVDPDQLASKEAIQSGSTLFSTLRYIVINEMT